MSLVLKALVDMIVEGREKVLGRFSKEKGNEYSREKEKRKESVVKHDGEETPEKAEAKRKEEEERKKYKIKKNIEETHREEEVFFEEHVEKPVIESIEKETEMVKNRIAYEMRGVEIPDRNRFDPP